MKKQLLLLAMILLPMVASAYDIAVANADGVTIYYNYINNGNELEVTFRDYSVENRYNGIINIPEEVAYNGMTLKVTAIGPLAFRYCALTSVSIPFSVKEIGTSAFEDCGRLTSIVLPNSIGYYPDTFHYTTAEEVKIIITDFAASCNGSIRNIQKNLCSGEQGPILIDKDGNEITEYIIPDSVTSISEHAFAYCGGLTSVTIGNNVTSIGESAFYKCKSMSSLTIGNSVKTIKDGAFGHCENLTSILVFGSPDYIGESIFNQSYNINEVTFDCEKVASLFHNTSVKKITMTDKVTSIGWSAFKECYELASITIPNSVIEIGFYAFEWCRKLSSVTFGNSVTSLGQCAFRGCVGLTSITIPGTIKTIGNSAFEGCNSLTSVTINDGVSNIGSKAFYNCRKLSSSIFFPSSIKSIDGKAFEGVVLDTIYLATQNPPEIREKSDSWSTFDTWHYPAYLYVPAGTIDKYKATKGWKDFVYIKEGNPTRINTVENIKNNNTTIYDLNGVRQSEPQKGINIINGKKYVKK